MKSTTRNSKWIYPVLLISSFSGSSFAAKPSAEEVSFRISKSLKPIDDKTWSQIAGDKIQQNYEVAKGDNLYTVSNRLFGDPKYWPKIWSMNNAAIRNPHVIRPGQKVTFQLGTGDTLPKLELTQDSPKYVPSETRVASNEWEKLPPQRWEKVQTTLPAEIDPLGFDKNSKIRFGKPASIDLFTYVTTSKAEKLGTIEAALNENEFMTLGQRVYIKATGALEIGQEVSIATDEIELESKIEGTDTKREAFAYLLSGRVKIIGRDTNYFVGRVTMVREFIPRGAMIIPNIPAISYKDPVAGAAPLRGALFRHPGLTTSTLTQHKLAFVNLGSSDGIEPGMYFKAYQHNDLNTDEVITKEYTIPTSEMQVMQVSDHYSTVLMTNSALEVEEGSPVELVTDLSTLLIYQGDHERMMNDKIRERDVFDEKPEAIAPPTAPDAGADELEALDDGDENLTDDQKKELQQLEKHKGDAIELEDESAILDADPEEVPVAPPAEGTTPPANATPVAPVDDGLEDALDGGLDMPEPIQETPAAPTTSAPTKPADPNVIEDVPNVDEGDLDQLLNE